MSDTASDTISDKTQREVLAYNSLVTEAPSITSGQALTLVATSSIETNGLMLLTRSDSTVLPVSGCYPVGPRVSMEADFNSLGGLSAKYGSAGGGNISGIVIDPNWYGDTDGMAILQKALNLQQETGSDGKTYWVHVIDYSTPWNQVNQLGFEYALVNQKGNLLRQWDMGPMNMRCMGMGPVAASIGWKQTTGFPASWDDMFALYTSQTYADAFTKGGGWYLPPVYNGPWPGDNPSDDSAALAWCGRQLGTGSSSPAAQSYATSLMAKMASIKAAVAAQGTGA